jgi:hypothetical protein
MKERGSVGPDSRVAPAEHVRFRAFDDDLVMVDLQGGQYFALDVVGARMWELLTSGKTPAQVAATLTAEYDATEEDILRDCIRLTDELLKHRLLVVGSP